MVRRIEWNDLVLYKEQDRKNNRTLLYEKIHIDESGQWLLVLYLGEEYIMRDCITQPYKILFERPYLLKDNTRALWVNQENWRNIKVISKFL